MTSALLALLLTLSCPYGRVATTDTYAAADFVVRMVRYESHADCVVRVVRSSPRAGEWQFVGSHPDFTIYVTDDPHALMVFTR